ncbi:MAG TPA: transposase [Prosthecobacter sp.]
MQAEALTWQQRLVHAAQLHGGKVPADEWTVWQEFQQVQLRALERLLDEGLGECLLRQPAHQGPIIEALHHFEGVRCEMQAYTIMPNHAHVLCRPIHGHAVENLTRAWKRHSADHVHRLLGRAGSLWQDESFDRVIRDEDHYRQAVRYIAKNPLKAGLQSSDAVVWLHPRIIKANAAGT